MHSAWRYVKVLRPKFVKLKVFSCMSGCYLWRVCLLDSSSWERMPSLLRFCCVQLALPLQSKASASMGSGWYLMTLETLQYELKCLARSILT